MALAHQFWMRAHIGRRAITRATMPPANATDRLLTRNRHRGRGGKQRGPRPSARRDLKLAALAYGMQPVAGGVDGP